MFFLRFYKVIIGFLIFLIILILGFLSFYFMFNKNLNKSLTSFNIDSYEQKISTGYKDFLEEAKSSIPSNSYNNLLEEVSTQQQFFSKTYNIDSSFKKFLTNKSNKDIINSKIEEIKSYNTKLTKAHEFLLQKDELPQNELPGYFVLMQIIINDIYNLDLDVQFEYNNEKVKIAFLTFDDGPTENTQKILDILSENDVKGTFFLIGNRINSRPEDVQSIIDQGSSLALHSFTHDTSKYKKENTIEDEMNKTRDLLKEEYDYDTNLIRIPTGSTILDDTQRKNLVDAGYNIIDWNIDSADWRTKEKDSTTVYNNVANNLTSDKEIILFHEKDTTLKVLQDVIDVLREKNYYIVPMPPEHFVSYKFGDI